MISFSQERDNHISLNGEWEIIYDIENEGREKQIHTIKGFDKFNSEKIQVPSGWRNIIKIMRELFIIKKLSAFQKI